MPNNNERFRYAEPPPHVPDYSIAPNELEEETLVPEEGEGILRILPESDEMRVQLLAPDQVCEKGIYFSGDRILIHPRAG